MVNHNHEKRTTKWMQQLTIKDIHESTSESNIPSPPLPHFQLQPRKRRISDGMSQSPAGIAAMKHNQGIPGLHISHRIHGAGIYANITGVY